MHAAWSRSAWAASCCSNRQRQPPRFLSAYASPRAYPAAAAPAGDAPAAGSAGRSARDIGKLERRDEKRGMNDTAARARGASGRIRSAERRLVGRRAVDAGDGDAQQAEVHGELAAVV